MENFIRDTEFLTRLLQNMPGLFYERGVDENNYYFFLSDGCEKLTGYKKEELLSGSTISFKKLIHGDDIDFLLSYYKLTYGGETLWNATYRIICKDGVEKWVKEYTSGVFNEDKKLVSIKGFIQDISAEKESVSIFNAFSSYRKAINSGSIVSITDKKGRIQFVNELFCEYSKYPREELMGKDHRIVNSGYHSKEFFIDLWKTISSGKIWRGEIRNRAKDGSYYWVDTVISPILNKENEIEQYLSIRNIITERKKYEEELRKAYSAIITAEEQERQRFSSEIHDGIAPELLSIQLFFNVLNETEDSDERREYIDKINFIISKTINDCRLICRNVYPKELLTFGLIESVKSVFDMFEKTTDIKFTLEADMNIDKFLDMNEKFTIFRILQENINNTVKYADARKIHVLIVNNKSDIIITFTNDGVPLKKEVLQDGASFMAIKRRVSLLNGTFEFGNTDSGVIFNYILPVMGRRRLVKPD